ncbi:MAG: hypothetical protein ACE5JI_07510 [Acidobacteriota bacterium]
MSTDLALLVAALAALLPQQRSQDARSLIERVVENQEHNQELQRQYAFMETVTTEHLRKDGSVAKTESKTFAVTPTPAGEYRRLVAKNGRPLSPKEEAAEEKKLRKHLRKQLRRTPAERQKAREQLKNRVGRFQTRLRQALEVYDFAPLPDDVIDGRRLRVFQFLPRPGYRPRSRATKVLARLEGTVWIDPGLSQIAKLHMRFRKDMKFLLGIFGRVSTGTEAVAEQRRINDELWVLDSISIQLRARFYFLKRYRRRITYSYTDYQRFTVETEEKVAGR